MILLGPARQRLTALLALTLAGAVLAACGSSGEGGEGDESASRTAPGVKPGLTVYFIPKDTQNPYEVLADEGGTRALAELGGTVVVSSGLADTAAEQLPSVQAAVRARADAIVIAANDPTALCPSLAEAAEAGIKILTFDSDISCGGSPPHLFVNQADTRTIGTSQVDLLAEQIGGAGEIAVLSAGSTAPNQNAWIAAMKEQLPRYPKMKLVATVYGDDDAATSLTVLLKLLADHPNLKGIIAPTSVGIAAVAQYLSTHPDVAARVTLTGLGLPSQMRSYVKDGTVTSFELWNPNDLGYLAGYAAAALASGTADLTPGSSFGAGKLGTHTVLAPAGGTGPSVVLGPPTVFDAGNIDRFDF